MERRHRSPATRQLLQDAYGTAAFELKAPMSPDLRMPTAANENLMVSVALHQLESKGLLNIRCLPAAAAVPGACALPRPLCAAREGFPEPPLDPCCCAFAAPL